jgi:threonine synthase
VSVPASHLVCGGCGAAPAPAEPYPFRCPNANGNDIDHVLVRVLDADRVSFPTSVSDGRPFVVYRELLHSYHRARDGGMTDAAFVDLVVELDEAVARVDGHGFRVTPFGRNDLLSDRLGFTADGGVWLKDETGNVAGSHKGRHLMGVLLHLEVVERLALPGADRHRPLAVASCGNAALAAAVLARAVDRPLEVFVPPDADRSILRRLDNLGAGVVVCGRAAGARGDPTFAGLRRAVADGAIPFTCQGNENGLVIEGGETLAYEIVAGLRTSAAVLDHLVVQVGGGALASACVQAFGEAVELGVLDRRPRIHTVQTTGAHPLERAFHRVRDRLPAAPDRSAIDAAVQDAACHRSEFMWPWEQEPRSIATGILDDETYDWRAVVTGMLETGGRPIVAGEDVLATAHELGQAAGFRVEPTGTAGLAAAARWGVAPGDRVAVLFTGMDRTVAARP